jgi:hypothetical protein
MPVLSAGGGRTVVAPRRFYRFRDDFGASVLGPAWTDTGGNFAAEDGSLVQTTAPGAWTEPLEHTAGLARATGRALAAWVLVGDRSGNFFVGWSSATGETDPRTDGHGWVMEEGFLQVSQPGTTVRLSGTGAGDYDVRPMEYLYVVALNATGALHLLRPFAVGDGTPDFGRNDPRTTLDADEAWVLWREDADTDAALHPAVNANPGALTPPRLDDLRVVDVAAWGRADFVAALGERFPTDGSLASPWVQDHGTWAVTSGTLGFTGGTSQRRARIDAGIDDYLVRCRITLDSADATKKVGLLFRGDTDESYNILVFESGNLVSQGYSAGASFVGTAFSQAFSATAGQTYDLAVMVIGTQTRFWVDGVVQSDWFTFGLNPASSWVGAYAAAATDATWDNFTVDPITAPLPVEVLHGLVPQPWTVGATLASDDFTGSNGTTLTAHDASWTSLSGTSEIQSNRAVVTAGATYAVTPNDFEVAADLVMPGSLTHVRAGLYARYQDANNYIAVRCFKDPGQPGTDEIETNEVVGGVAQDIRKVQFPSYFASSTTYALTVQVNGDLCRVVLDGQPVMSHRTAIASGDPGLYCEDANDTGTAFDNFVVKAVP